MNENTMTEFKTEGSPAFPVENTEKDNSAESSTEKTTADSTQSSTEDKTKTEDKKKADENFANHPRWKEREDDWSKRFNDQETRHTSEIEAIRKDIETKFEQKREKLADSEIPEWFGGTDEQWKQYKAHEDSRLQQAEDRALKRLEEKATKEAKEIEESTKYMNDTVASLESDKTLNPDGAKIDRNKLFKICYDNDLVDTKGRWNYKAGFLMMKANPASANADTIKEKKQIAGATVNDNKAETKKNDYMTSDDFKKPENRVW